MKEKVKFLKTGVIIEMHPDYVDRAVKSGTVERIKEPAKSKPKTQKKEEKAPVETKELKEPKETK